MMLRPIEQTDVPDVLRLNERHVELLAPLTDDRLRELMGWADRAQVIEHDGTFAGFVITFAPGSAYDGDNFAWFAEHHPGSYYLDRIVLHESTRRLGLGSQVYDALEARAAEVAGAMALEVNIDPPNEPSLAFHRRRGYRDVGEQWAGEHRVTMMLKAL